MTGSDCRSLQDFLDDQLLMSLATSDKFSLWCATVYYLSDNDLNLYFISGNHTDHVKNILKNHKVAFSITDKNHSEDVLSVQARGFCERVGESRLSKTLEKWNTKFPEKKFCIKDLNNNGASMYKIILTRLKYLNTKLPEKVIEFYF